MRKSLRIALVLLGLVIGAALAGCKPSNDLQDPPGFIPPCEVSVLHGLDPVWMFQNGWELPCPDHDNDSILNECDVDLTLGEDCNLNGIDDSCEQDTDLDNIIDDCDDDIDGDLIPNECDIDETMGLDCDEDGQDDSCELDTDNDLIIDDCDDDDDNDGDTDDDEIDCGSDPLDASDTCFDCQDEFDFGYALKYTDPGHTISVWNAELDMLVDSLVQGSCDVLDVSTWGWADLTFYSQYESIVTIQPGYTQSQCRNAGSRQAGFEILLAELKARYLSTVEDMDGDLVQDRCDDDVDGDGVDGTCDEDDEDNTNTTDTCVANCSLQMLGQHDVARKGYFTIDGVEYRIELKNFGWDNRGFYTPSRAYVKVNGGGSAETTKFVINWNQHGNLYLGNFDLSSGQGNVAIWEAIQDSYFCFNNDCQFRLVDGSQNPDLPVTIDWRD